LKYADKGFLRGNVNLVVGLFVHVGIPLKASGDQEAFDEVVALPFLHEKSNAGHPLFGGWEAGLPFRSAAVVR